MSNDVVSGPTTGRVRRAMSSTVGRMVPTGATRRPFGITRTSSDRRDHPDEIAADLAERFALAVSTGSAATLRPLLADGVVCSTPSGERGERLHTGVVVHRGIEAVLEALFTPAADDITIVDIHTSELMVSVGRALVVIAVEAQRDGLELGYEAAFHLQCRDGHIIGVTEYSGDPVAEALLR